MKNVFQAASSKWGAIIFLLTVLTQIDKKQHVVTSFQYGTTATLNVSSTKNKLPAYSARRRPIFRPRTTSNTVRRCMTSHDHGHGHDVRVASCSSSFTTTTGWHRLMQHHPPHYYTNPIATTRLFYKNKQYEDHAEESNAKGIRTTMDSSSRHSSFLSSSSIDNDSSTTTSHVFQQSSTSIGIETTEKESTMETRPIPNISQQQQQQQQDKKPIISRIVSGSSSSIDSKKHVTTIKSLEEYQEKMKEYQDRLVVIRFYSHWCKSCKAVEAKFYRLARVNPNVQFIDMPITKENQEELKREFHIQAVPYGHIVYPNVGLVENLPMGKMHWEYFEDTFYTYVHGYCDVSSHDEYEI